MPSRLGNVDARHAPSLLFQPALQLIRGRPNSLFIERIVRHANFQFIQCSRCAEALCGLARDEPVSKTFHPRRSQAGGVSGADEIEFTRRAVGNLHDNSFTYARFRHREPHALQQNFILSGRPLARFRRKRIQPQIVEVVDDEQPDVAPFIRSDLNAAHHHLPRFGLGDLWSFTHLLHQLSIDAIEQQCSRSGIGLLIVHVHLAR